MRRILLVGLLLCAAAVQAEGIVEVLLRSQQLRLDALQPAAPDSEETVALHSAFAELLQVSGTEAPVELRVIVGDTLAETLLGRVVVVNAALGRRPRAEQLFILAHELGHVVQGHQAQMGAVFQKWVPGAVVQDHTDAVAPMLGRAASGLAHRQEYAADAHALRTLGAMGYSRDEVVGMFMRMGLNPATATHPAGARRALALRVTALDDDARTTAAIAHAPVPVR